MTVLCVKYVKSSEVFDGLSTAEDAFAEHATDCSWGDNDFSLVSPQLIIYALDEAEDTDEIEQAIKRLKSLAPDVYVDLEH
jgi:hypothetical protein